MKSRIALLGCLTLAGNVAMANVDCAKAPYGESVGRFGRDEFQLGAMSVAHNANSMSAPGSVSSEIDRQMRAACLAKYYGKHLPRYTRLGLAPGTLAAESVGEIAAVAIGWNAPRRQVGDTVASSSGTVSSGAVRAVAPATRPRAVAAAQVPSSAAPLPVMKVASSFPACPRQVDLRRLLSAALIDNAAWPEAEAAGKRHGCIELHAGEPVYRVAINSWSGVARVRPVGLKGTYWTDAMAVK
jgi:hypothetical protein